MGQTYVVAATPRAEIALRSAVRRHGGPRIILLWRPQQTLVVVGKGGASWRGVAGFDS